MTESRIEGLARTMFDRSLAGHDVDFETRDELWRERRAEFLGYALAALDYLEGLATEQYEASGRNIYDNSFRGRRWLRSIRSEGE